MTPCQNPRGAAICGRRSFCASQGAPIHRPVNSVLTRKGRDRRGAVTLLKSSGWATPGRSGCSEGVRR